MSGTLGNIEMNETVSVKQSIRDKAHVKVIHYHGNTEQILSNKAVSKK